MGFAKPIDAGTGRVCASYLPDGSWLSISTVHPVHGIVELSGMPPFDERHRGDPDAARRYRQLMASPSSAFLWIEGAAVAGIEPLVTAGADSIGLRLRLSPPAVRSAVARLRFTGRLDRPALAEITETHPPLPTGAKLQLEADGGILRIAAPELPAAAAVEVDQGGWRTTDDGAAILEIPASTVADIGITVRLHALNTPPSGAAVGTPATDPMRRSTPDARTAGSRYMLVPPRAEPLLERITRRALDYVRGCTALITGPGERTILTDHRLLPLSWTRDAYWQALLLLVADDAGVSPGGAEIVEGHLRWLWLRTERPDGAWVRSHHANGLRKDLPFQADQQLYPMLELADYARLTERMPLLPPGGVAGSRRRWAELIREAWRPVEESRDPVTGLMRSDENASDDPAPLPLIAASQILGWYTAQRLLTLDADLELGLDAEALATFAEAMRSGLAEHAEIDTPAGRMWAYAVDGRGDAALFHDAGDLPTVLAPLWGFSGTEDPAWRATMRFAFTPANPAYAAGPFGSLGSPHTSGGWALGDIQEWVFASLTGDAERAERVLDRIAFVSAEDGMLPEAYASDDGRFVARHWFAWPGAVVGVLWLLDRRGLLREWLQPSRVAEIHAMERPPSR